MRRCECGIVRGGVGRQLPSPWLEAGRPPEAGAFVSAAPRDKARRMVRWPLSGQTQPAGGGPSRGFPASPDTGDARAPASWSAGGRRSASYGPGAISGLGSTKRQGAIAVGKKCTPPGWPRSKPKTPRAERRASPGVASLLSLRSASGPRGPEVRGSVATRRSARPHFFGGPEDTACDAPASLRTGAIAHALSRSSPRKRGSKAANDGLHCGPRSPLSRG